MIELYFDKRSNISPYMQLVEQIKRALLLGTLQVGDQIPTLKEVVRKLAINPNTVLKAYRELEHDNLIEMRPGIGTFVTRSLAGSGIAYHSGLRISLLNWLKEARHDGLDEESILALFDSVRRDSLAGVSA